MNRGLYNINTCCKMEGKHQHDFFSVDFKLYLGNAVERCHTKEMVAHLK